MNVASWWAGSDADLCLVEFRDVLAQRGFEWSMFDYEHYPDAKIYAVRVNGVSAYWWLPDGVIQSAGGFVFVAEDTLAGW